MNVWNKKKLEFGVGKEGQYQRRAEKIVCLDSFVLFVSKVYRLFLFVFIWLIFSLFIKCP